MARLSVGNMKTGKGLIHSFLENSASLFPDKVAVVHEKNRVEYSLINRSANQLAHRLIESGAGLGDRVVILSENNVEYIACYYGILKAGCIAVPLNPDLKADGLLDLLEEIEPKAIFVSRKYEKAFRSLGWTRSHACMILTTDSLLINQSSGKSDGSSRGKFESPCDENSNLKIDPDSCAAIVYTSGSLGKPKGVMLSHANIVANTRAIVEYLKLTADDIQMVVLPFYYVMGNSLLNTHIAVGGRLIINNEFAYMAAVLKQIAEERVTGFSGVPSTYARLLYRSPLSRYRDRWPSLRYCSQAGGHMPRHIKLELLKVLPAHTQLVIMYGATEASARLSYVPPERLKAKIDSVGIPISGVTIEALSPAGKKLRPRTVGELVARGPNIMLGYYKDKAGTKKVLDRHGFHTGDLGFYDEDGFFFLIGRKDDQIKISGHRIDPAKIEDVVMDSGLAIECIIFPSPDSYGDLRLAGLVVPVSDEGDVIERIMGHCRRKLPKYEVPASLEIVDEIPKSGTGKPERRKSQELFLKKRTGGNR